MQEELKSGSNQQPLSGHSFRVGATLDLLEQDEPLEKIMHRGIAVGLNCHEVFKGLGFLIILLSKLCNKVINH